MSFINDNYIFSVLEEAKNPTTEEINEILEKARYREKLSHIEIAKLMNATDQSQINEIYTSAGKLKDEIYGQRVVMFAPLYISNFCVNNCKYCGYKRDNKFDRRKLTMDEIKEEAKILEGKGHKRLALEVGEDHVNAPFEYIVEALKTIYDNTGIRRINVNIAATSVDNYRTLKECGIGTYILFQETYHKDTYDYMHDKSLKGDYQYHLTAFDRAMEGGIDDVGGGVLFGLYDWKFEVLAMIIHNEYLEEQYGVGFHTVSVPRLKKAEGMNLSDFKYIISDEEFKRIVTVLRLAIPYVGLILSTRETKEMRNELLKYGVSQLSAGSKTDVGGYKQELEQEELKPQFKLSDERSVNEVIKDLIADDYIPSYCTACYRSNRTGDRFMALAQSGTIGFICEPNAIMTLTEYIMDYADEDLKVKGIEFVKDHANRVRNQTVKDKLIKNIDKIINGERDLFF